MSTRKVPSSSAAMSGTLTRSKSDLFLHRTRSGHSRPDPKHHHHQPKDLRLKRVFSRIDDKRSESGDLDISKRSTDDLRETTPPDLDTVSGFDAGKGIRVSEETNLGNFSECNMGLSPCPRSKVIGNPSSNSYRRLLPYLKYLAKDGSSGIQILQSHNLSPKTKKSVLPDIKVVSDFNGGKGVRVSEESNLDNSFENKQMSSPCLQSKLIVNRSSISYKRLLPYLKNLDKDGSSDIKILQSHNHSPKVEKTMNETTLELNPSCEQQNNVVPLGDSPMVNSGGNCYLAENPVIEKPILNSHEEIVQNPPISIQSPIHELTSKVRLDDDHMNKLDGQEQKGTSKERCICDAENSKVSVACSDDMAQSTPPDVDLTRKLDGVENGSRAFLESELNNTSKESMGLVLCSRSKLYRNPSSFSYRRLLPYLMNLAKNDPNGLEIIQSHNYTAKVDNSIEERPLMLNDFLSPRQQHHTATLDDSSLVCLKENQDLEGSHVLDSKADIHFPKTTELPNLCNKNKVQVLGSTDQIYPKRLDFEFEICKSSSCSPTISEDLSFEELGGDMITETDRKHNKKVSLFETFGPGANRALAPRKSILKKQSRWCKGICMCLDCASFRVHAERAYEFSRRQMSDADEVVERLMKELSCLRNVMEGSLEPTVDCDRSYTVLQVNQEQVKRVCQRAFSAEEQAKSRMRQMFCDLNTHCKIPGPRVTFSNTVDESIIPWAEIKTAN